MKNTSNSVLNSRIKFMKPISVFFATLLLMITPVVFPVDFLELASKHSTVSGICVGAVGIGISMRLAKVMAHRAVDREHARMEGDPMKVLAQREHDREGFDIERNPLLKAAIREHTMKAWKAYAKMLCIGGATSIACGVLTKVALDRYAKNH